MSTYHRRRSLHLAPPPRCLCFYFFLNSLASFSLLLCAELQIKQALVKDHSVCFSFLPRIYVISYSTLSDKLYLFPLGTLGLIPSKLKRSTFFRSSTKFVEGLRNLLRWCYELIFCLHSSWISMANIKIVVLEPSDVSHF